VWWRIAAVSALCALGLAARDVAAQPSWTLQTVIDPPVLPDVDPTDHMAFGYAVAMGSAWMVVGAPSADCPDTAVPGNTIPDAGRIFVYKRVSGVWQYHQSFCATGPVQHGRYGFAVDIYLSSFIVGAPGATASANGLVDIFRLDKATGSWSRQLSTSGAAGGALGQSVALSQGLAIAGEPYYNTQRGRIRTWRITGSGITPELAYAPAGLVDYDRYGKKVSLHASGCALPGCTSLLDVAAVLGGSRVYVATRNAGAWQASQSLIASSGAQFGAYNMAVDVSHYQMLVSMQVTTAGPAIGCPVGPAVRVFNRDSGGTFSLTGDACPPPVDELITFGTAVAADRATHQFMVASPDNYSFGSAPVPEPASVSTFDGYLGVTYVDSVMELSLAPAGSGPEQYNDRYGYGISQYGSYMAVGAPWMHIFTAAPGIGYVAVYNSCC
jgi:hypothetical protein